MLCLHILCLCVRHCGDTFQRTLAKSELLKDLGRIGDRSMWTATDIHRMVLHLLQEWAFEVKNYPDFQLMYNYLRSKNAPFEPRNGPISTIFRPYPGIEEQLMQLQQGSMVGSAGSAGAPGGPGGPEGAEPRAESENGGSSLIGPDLLRPGRTVDVLKSDLEVARGTVALLEEVMDKIKAEGNWEGIREDYCVEVAEACLAVQKRIEVLMGGELEDEAVMATALEVNDLALIALKVRMELLEIADGTKEAPEVNAGVGDGGKGDGGTGDGGTGDGDDGKDKGADDSEAPPLIDLLDLDYEPQPVTSSEQQQQQSSQTNTADPFAHLEQSADASNPFAPKGAAPTASAMSVASVAMEEVNSNSNSNAFDDDESNMAPVILSGGGNPFADDFEEPVATGETNGGINGGTRDAPSAPPPLQVRGAHVYNGGPQSAPAEVTKNTLFVSGPSFPETFEAGPSTVPRRHTTDAFEGLVSMGKKNETPAPDPPRGPSMKPTGANDAADVFNAFDSLG